MKTLHDTLFFFFFKGRLVVWPYVVSVFRFPPKCSVSWAYIFGMTAEFGTYSDEKFNSARRKRNTSTLIALLSFPSFWICGTPYHNIYEILLYRISTIQNSVLARENQTGITGFEESLVYLLCDVWNSVGQIYSIYYRNLIGIFAGVYVHGMCKDVSAFNMIHTHLWC